MNGREFVRQVRRYARDNRLEFEFDAAKGKGSHGEARLGGLRTTVQHGEIPKGTLANMLKDLAINRMRF